MTTGQPVTKTATTTTAARPVYAVAVNNGENYLSGDYQKINTLLRALAVINPQHLDVGWKLPDQDEELKTLAAEWQKQARAVGITIHPEEEEGSWGPQQMATTWSMIVSIRERWDWEYATLNEKYVWRGDSHYFHKSTTYQAFLDAKKQGQKATLIFPSLMSTSYTNDLKAHSYIGDKTVLWQIELAEGHGGRILGGNNPSEGELTFDAGTVLHIDDIITSESGKPGMHIDVGGQVITLPKVTTLIKARIGADPRHPHAARQQLTSRLVTLGQGIPTPPPPPSSGKVTARKTTEEQRNKDRVAAIIEEHRVNFPPPQFKRAFFLMGGPGSGKSQVWKERYQTLFPEALVVDPDAFKVPGGDHNLQHADSKATAKALLTAARQAGLSFVYDSTGSDHSLYIDAMQASRNAGWTTTAIVVVAPATVALKRVNNRPDTDATRQVIGNAEVKSMNDAVRLSLEKLLAHEEVRRFLTEVEVWDNGADGPSKRAWAWVAAARGSADDLTGGLPVFDRLRNAS